MRELRTRFERPGGFLLLTAEEISDRFEGRPIHHGAVNVGEEIAPPGGATVCGSRPRTLALVAAEGRRTGRPVLGHLNHPNYEWGVAAEDLAVVVEERFFEVYNGLRLVRNEGDATHRSSEAIWDYVLAVRLAEMADVEAPPLWVLATDDAHDFREIPGVSNPGRGWVVVRATELTPDAILTGLLAGDFYASSGVALRAVERSDEGLAVEVEPAPGVAYTIRFIGTRGRPGDTGRRPRGGRDTRRSVRRARRLPLPRRRALRPRRGRPTADTRTATRREIARPPGRSRRCPAGPAADGRTGEPSPRR